MAEKEPKTVESLFTDVPFAEDGGDIALCQKHMDSFMAQIEALRLKLFPKYWKYHKKLDLNDNLHIMAFDLMYCCRCYNIYKGLTFVIKCCALKAGRSGKSGRCA